MLMRYVFRVTYLFSGLMWVKVNIWPLIRLTTSLNHPAVVPTAGRCSTHSQQHIQLQPKTQCHRALLSVFTKNTSRMFDLIYLLSLVSVYELMQIVKWPDSRRGWPAPNRYRNSFWSSCCRSFVIADFAYFFYVFITRTPTYLFVFSRLMELVALSINSSSIYLSVFIVFTSCGCVSLSTVCVSLNVSVSDKMAACTFNCKTNLTSEYL